MSTYVRPGWLDPLFRDGAGAVVTYGSRWGSDGPPPAAYSLVSHSARFAPLHLVADALIAHLRTTFDVRVSWDASYAGDFLRSPNLERVARVTPNDSAAAPLTLGFSTFPGLILHAGLLHDFAYPTCGCEACDETAAGEVENFERLIFAVVAGEYQETYTPGAELPLAFVLQGENGQQAGHSTTDNYLPELLDFAASRLRELPNGWAAWPLK